MQSTLAHAGLSALEALILPIFELHPGEPVPRGIAKYCNAKDVNDAVLLAKIFHSIKAR
jgi:hypothetical protein